MKDIEIAIVQFQLKDGDILNQPNDSSTRVDWMGKNKKLSDSKTAGTNT